MTPRFTPPSRPSVVNPNPTAFAPYVEPRTGEAEKIDFQTRINENLKELCEVVDVFNGDKDETGRSKTAIALIDARQEVNRIQAELNAAENRSKLLEQAGSAADKYNGAVSRIEGQFQKVVDLYTQQVQSEVIKQWFGGAAVPLQKLSPDRRSDLKLHARIEALRQFTYVSQYRAGASQVEIEKRVNTVGEKFQSLAAHIAADQAK
jgi:hypothetical protein